MSNTDLFPLQFGQTVLTKSVTLIGRAVECDLQLTDKRVSGTHCRLRRLDEESGEVIVDDLSYLDRFSSLVPVKFGF